MTPWLLLLLLLVGSTTAQVVTFSGEDDDLPSISERSGEAGYGTRTRDIRHRVKTNRQSDRRRCGIVCRDSFGPWTPCDDCLGFQKAHRHNPLPDDCRNYERRCRKIRYRRCERNCRHGGIFEYGQCFCPYGTTGICCQHRLHSDKFDGLYRY